MKNIRIVGARTHNLKNVSLEIEKEKISVFSGISGSGKSSLAFDTIFAEGQRRYVDNLSSFARQVIGVVEKPDVDSIEGIPPTISIDQKSIARSPRSTVGTITDAYDYLRLIFSRFGKVRCPKCQKEILSGEVQKNIKKIIFNLEEIKGEKDIKIFAPVVRNLKGSFKDALKRFTSSPFNQFRIDGQIYSRVNLENIKLSKDDLHNIEVLTFEAKFQEKLNDNERKSLIGAINKSFELADDLIYIWVNGKEKVFSRQPYCEVCNIYFPSIQPRLFSFNSPYGACPRCQGLGVIKKVLPDLVIPNQRLTIAEGAIRPWSRLAGQNGWLNKSLSEVAKRHHFSLDVPVEQLSKDVIKVILYGDEEFEGVVANLERKYRETDSEYLRQEIESYMIEATCNECGGRRLNKFAESILLSGKRITELVELEIDDLIEFFKKEESKLPKESNLVIKELISRLKNLDYIGLGYLTLARSSETLSGGEAQRIRLGVQFDSFLSGVLYVMDEPTISLHSVDIERLISAFKRLKSEGNTVILVEHDREILENSDFIYDIGPGAGKNGGEIVATGTPAEIKRNPKSLTGRYLSGKKKILEIKNRKKPNGGRLKIVGASENNLQNIEVEIPLGLFVCVTGVSGSGKSTLVYDILAKSLTKHFYDNAQEPGRHKMILGFQYIDKAIKIDQSPIGRTPRSNLATFTGLFTPVREIFAELPEAKLRGYQASQFSFNLKGGRCENCRGDGAIKIEMYFMPDVYVTCEECAGKRYNKETLEIKYKDKTIADILSMSVDEAAEFFKANSEITDKLTILQKVGLGYLPLGQSATTLSGGEAQRIKLATELSRPSTGKTIYILDEPTTGLHFEDISKLLIILQELVNRGNSVLVIEHNLDVIKNADWIIDMGPGGGHKGGLIVAEGPPEEIVKNSNSITGKYLKPALRQK